MSAFAAKELTLPEESLAPPSSEEVQESFLVPYPGLRPFRDTESELFCGRGQHRIELLTKLERCRFLAVLGASGSGKSSLVMAGLLPDIAEGLLLGVAPGMAKNVYFKPGLNPYRSLAEGLADTLEADRFEVEQALRHSSVGFSTVLERFGPASGAVDVGSGDSDDLDAQPAYFVIADQFEELFRFSSLGREQIDSENFRRERGDVPVLDSAHNEAQAFIDLLLNACFSSKHRVFVVLTMRSDFLHRCEAFDRLPGVISANQYLTPRLQRDQLEDVITVPLGHFDASIDPELVNLILNDLSPEQDQLPVLQHTLARMWQRPPTFGVNGKRVISIRDYRDVGGLTKALSWNGKEILTSVAAQSDGRLGEDEVGRFFRCLAEWDPSGALVRRPCTVGMVAAESGLALSDVLLIANQFRAPGTDWLMARTSGEDHSLDATVPLDLTHESLLRKWDLLSDRLIPCSQGSDAADAREKLGWMAQEKELRDSFQRLLERMREAEWPLNDITKLAKAWSFLLAVLWPTSAPNLTRTQVSRFREQLLQSPEPTEAWAKRYGGNWEDAKRFLWLAIFKKRLTILVSIGSVIGLFGWGLNSSLSKRNAREQQTKAELQAAKDREEKIEIERKAAAAEAEKAKANEALAAVEVARQREATKKAVSELNVQKAESEKVAQVVPKDAGSATGALENLAQTVRHTLVAQDEDAKRSLEQAKNTELELRTIAEASSRYLGSLGSNVTKNKQLETLREALKKQGYASASQNRPSAESSQFFLPGPVLFPAHKASVEAVAFLTIKDSLRVVSGATDHSARLWSLDGKSSEPILKHDASSLTVAGGSRLVVASADSFLRIWSPSHPATEYQLPAPLPNEGIVSGQIISDGRVAFGTTAGRIGLWKSPNTPPDFLPVPESKKPDFFKGNGSVNAIHYLPEKQWLLASHDNGLVDLWDIGVPKPMLLGYRIYPVAGIVRSASLSPRGDSALIPSASRTIDFAILGQLENRLQGDCVVRKLQHQATAIIAKFNGAGTIVATADSDGRIYLWQTTAIKASSTTQVQTPVVYNDHRRRVTRLQWAPDGRFLVTGDESGVICVWKYPNERVSGKYGALPLVFAAHQGAITSLAISPDGNFIVSGSVDGSVRVIPLRPTIAGPCLTNFGGPNDSRGSATEGLALLDEDDQRKPDYQALFLETYDPSKPGLARRLNPEQLYLAARWDYSGTSRSLLRKNKVTVRNPKTGKSVEAQAVDWGPAPSTGAVADLSPGLAKELGAEPNSPIEIVMDLVP